MFFSVKIGNDLSSRYYLYIGFFAMRSLCLAQREPGGQSLITLASLLSLVILLSFLSNSGAKGRKITYEINSYLSTSQYGRAGQCQNLLEEKRQWKRKIWSDWGAPGKSGSPDSISAYRHPMAHRSTYIAHMLWRTRVMWWRKVSTIGSYFGVCWIL